MTTEREDKPKKSPEPSPNRREPPQREPDEDKEVPQREPKSDPPLHAPTDPDSDRTKEIIAGEKP